MGWRDIAEWKHLGTLAVIGLAGWLGTVCLLGWQLYWDVYTPDTGIKASLSSHLETYEGEQKKITDALDGIVKVLGEVRTDQQEAYRRDMTMRGMGTQGSFGGTQTYVRVNADSDASIYKDGDRIKITKLGTNGRPSEEFIVRGEWTHPDSEVLVSFSTEACKILEVNGIVKVQLEPAAK